MGKTSILRPIFLLVLAAAILTCLGGFTAPAATPSDTLLESLQPQGPVSDFAGLMSPDERVQILDRLKALRRKTGTHVVLVTLQSLEGGQIDDFTVRLFNRWGVGEKGKNNGVMLMVAVQDRKARIEVGFGLESILTDTKSDGVLKEHLFPAFKRQHYADGLRLAVNRIAEIIEGGETAEPPQPKPTVAEKIEQSGTIQPQPGPMVIEKIEHRDVFQPQHGPVNFQPDIVPFAPHAIPATPLVPILIIFAVVAVFLLGIVFRLAGASGSIGGWSGMRSSWLGNTSDGWASGGRWTTFSSGGFGGGSFGGGGFGGGCSGHSSSGSSSFGGGSSGGGGASGGW